MIRVLTCIGLLSALLLAPAVLVAQQDEVDWLAGAGMTIQHVPEPSDAYIMAAAQLATPVPWAEFRVEGLYARVERDSHSAVVSTAVLRPPTFETPLYLVAGPGISVRGDEHFAWILGLGFETRLAGRRVLAELRSHHARDAFLMVGLATPLFDSER